MKPGLATFAIGRFHDFVNGIFCDLGQRRRGVASRLVEGMWKKGSLQVVKAARGSEDVEASSGDVWAASKRGYRLLSSEMWSLDKPAERLREHVAKGIRDDHLIVVDLGDVQKPSSRKMPFLGYVHDGSRDEQGPGHWLFESCVVQGRHDILPIENFLYSLSAPGTDSENIVILAAFERIRKATQGKGTFVGDRGFDRDRFFGWFEENDVRFLFRLRGDRSFHDPYGNPLGTAADFAQTMPLLHKMRVQNPRSGKTRRLPFAFQEVRRPGSNRPLWLVVAADAKDEERFLLLLTSVPVLTHVAAERAQCVPKQPLSEFIYYRLLWGLRAITMLGSG